VAGWRLLVAAAFLAAGERLVVAVVGVCSAMIVLR